MQEEHEEYTMEELSKVVDFGKGTTQAHVMASEGCQFTHKDILTLIDLEGWSVAHEMAAQGFVFSDAEIMNLATNDGERVCDVQS